MSTWRPINRPPFWKRWLPEWLHGPVKWSFQLALIGLVIGAGIAFFYLLLASRYDLDEVAKLPAGTTFYDRKGVPLDAPGSSGRRLVKRDEIPEFLVQALQAREDARFFRHSGVDVRGLARATVRNVKDRDFTQGASTLSMQLARNTFGMREKSLHRKLLEIALTLRIEARYSKDEILTHYLNRIYFGSGADGIEQAARTYFGKTTRELTPDECALVVGIIRGPHIYSPLRNPEAAVEQRRQTLARMATMGFVTAEKRDQLAAAPLRLADDEDGMNQTSYALQAVRRELYRILEGRDDALTGLRVSTTIDSAWQARLQDDLNRAVSDLEHEKSWTHPTHHDHPSGKEPDYVQYAAVTVETKSGAVLALIGGRDYADSRLDRTHSKRDLGSAFEPFIAAAASERGKLVLPGRPLQTGRQIGHAEVERIARRCGLDGPFVQGEDLFRGYVAASPREMATGLATIGNSGKRPRPFFIREIRDSAGKLIYSAKPELTQAIGANAAQDAASILKRRAGTRCFTGATNSERDAWTLRLGPSGSTAIWIGFDQPAKIAPEPRLDSLLDEFVKRLGNE